MDIYQTLTNDHEELKDTLAELISLKEDDDYRYVLIQQIEDLLVPHSRAEESVLYNTMRAVNADKKLVFHGYQEHLEAETILRSMKVMDKMNFGWKSLALKLQEALEHHIEEEETEIFAEARRAFTREEALAMADAFNELKPSFIGDSAIVSTGEMVMNLLPGRLADSLRTLSDSSKS